MEIVALVIAVVSLIVAVAAYYRSSDNEDIGAVERRLEDKIDRFGIVAQNAAASVESRVNAGYRRSIRLIEGLQSRVAALRREAVEEIREDLRRLARRLERLAERAAREVRDIKTGLILTLNDAEIGLRLTIDDARAHLKLIEAKQDLVLARLAVARQNPIEAEARVESALRDIEEARSLALGYHESLAELERQAQEMLVALRARAGTAKAALDDVIERTGRLLEEMSGADSEARTAA
jgi:hypothetical protein